MLRGIFTFCVFFLLSTLAYAQSTDILRIEYTSLPDGDGNNRLDRYKVLFNAPINIGADRYLILGAEYNKIDIQRNSDLPFDDSELNNLHVVDVNIGYIFKINPRWRFIGIITPRLASNFTNGIEGRDFLLNATATLWKERKDIDKPFRLVLGLTYNSTAGLPVPLPLINYYKRFHLKWSYVLGIPKSNLRYHLSEKHSFISALFLDGYFVNVQNDILLPDDTLGSSLSLSAVVGALGYQYNISRVISFYGWGGYTLRGSSIL
ncbi:MAG: DUF6268 family outer membrane beta-barrel protein, partial [Flavobacteriaceae bacterium]